MNKYLSVLKDLVLVYRIVPVTESCKSRKGMYFLAGNLFDFWFRFVYPEMEEIEKGKGSAVIESIKPQFNRYAGQHFKIIAMEILDILNDKGVLPFHFTGTGKWWHKGQEIDIVAFNETGKQVIFCEYKWSDRVNIREVLEHLKEKASLVPLQKEEEYTAPSSIYGATSCSLISGNFHSWSIWHRMRPHIYL